jgi:undecaprenyl diphosphate synthase
MDDKHDDANSPVPDHVAIIMDGNGRWAEGRNLSRSEGHRAGTVRVRPIAEACIASGVRHLTVYALSTENWSRPRDEIDVLLSLLGERLQSERKAIFEHRIRIKVLGSMDPLPPALRLTVGGMERATANFDRLTLNIAFNYGGRSEIVRAAKAILQERIDPEDITEDLFERYLYTADVPDPDLVIRTAGEMRLSNFLLWQSAYAEFYSTPTLWPDFDAAELQKALEGYAGRRRRYGGVASRSGVAKPVGED